jgi:hypothetical protein
MLLGCDENIANDVQNVLSITLQQNYFQFDTEYYKQGTDLVIGAEI